MDKKEIISRLNQQAADFLQTTGSLSDERFYKKVNDKWSAAETMQHLFLSIKPLNKLFPGPREVMLQWGRPEHPSRSFDYLVTLYKQVLATGVTAPAPFIPRPTDVDRQDVTERFTSAYRNLADNLIGWPEEELDAYLIPHPAYGKLTVREMMYFTIYHLQHHLIPLKQRLGLPVA